MFCRTFPLHGDSQMNNPDEIYHRLYAVAFTYPILWITHCGAKIIFCLWLKISRRTRIIFGVTLDDLISIYAFITVVFISIGFILTVISNVNSEFNSDKIQNVLPFVVIVLSMALLFSIIWKVSDSPLIRDLLILLIVLLFCGLARLGNLLRFDTMLNWLLDVCIWSREDLYPDRHQKSLEIESIYRFRG